MAGRRNSGAFERRKTEELLSRIELERVRLEKEERLVMQCSVIFNDSEYTEGHRKEDLVSGPRGSWVLAVIR